MLCFDNETQKDKNTFKDNSQSEFFYLLMPLFVIKVPLFWF